MTAIELIVAAAERHADRIALEDGDGRGVTYGELLGRARRVAGSIAAGSIVELEAARTVDFIAGCLAAWLAGAAWIPIDPDEPAWRLAAIRAAIPAWCEGLAYVIATSGSTGTPKLVMISHRGLPALLHAQIEAFALAPGARALWLHAPRFDASVSGWCTALAAGATLVIPAAGVLDAPARLRDELARRGITHVVEPHDGGLAFVGRIDRQRKIAGIPEAGAGDPLERELAVLWCDALGVAEITSERFRDAGGDSLAQLTLQAAATARGIALDAAALAVDPTFAELVAAVREVRAASITVADCEARGLAARAAHRDRAAAPPGPLARKPSADVGVVLVTGATGRLGGALLRAWRTYDPRPIALLVRAPDPAAARRRLPADAAGVEVICGDLARPYFGLAPDAWHDLTHRVSAVVHAAAHVDLVAGWDAHAAVNVEGTAEVARFVAARPRIAWHHVSTLSVFAGTDHKAGVHREAATPSPGALAHGGYTQTKIAAEAIARASRGRLAPTTILRLGMLVGEAPPADDKLVMTLRGLARLGAIPAGAAERCLDFTPVEHAAAAMAMLATHAEWAKLDDTHHIASARGVTFGQLVAGLRGASVELVELPPAGWLARARARLADPDVAMAYLSLGCALGGGAPPSFDLFVAPGAEFDVARTARMLTELGVAVPEIDQALIDRVVAAALRVQAEP